jgi:hypothetical protein
MRMTSTGRRMAAWFACFAILLGVLAPSISHALAEARGQSLVWEICRSDSRVGQPTVKPVDGQLPVSGDPMAHCAYCLPHGGSDGLLPPVHALPLFASAGAVRPASFHLAALPQAPLAMPPARGPPAIS